MPVTFQSTESYTVVCCYKCGIHFGMPSYLQQQRQENGGEFFCPNGHGQVYCKSEVKKLQEELLRIKSARDQEHARAEAEEAARIAAEKKLERTKQRLKGGKCPCCTRNFVSLARHMASKHPGYVAP